LCWGVGVGGPGGAGGRAGGGAGDGGGGVGKAYARTSEMGRTIMQLVLGPKINCVIYL